jgi:hypothetical protein
MADELKISITATDGASKVFEKVERSAKEMGDGIEDAAEKAGGEFKEMVRAAQQMSDALDRNADQSAQSMTALGRSIDRLAASMDASLAGGARDAATALNTVESEAEQANTAVNQLDASTARSGASLRDFGSAGATAGQGLALLGGSFALYAGQARDHEMAIAALSRTYGETAGQFVALADSMQSTTVFSNDQVIEAANLMGTLQRNYQMTSDEIQQLIQISADLAAVNGVSLADASQRVAAAMRGEAESAEVLGLTMNDAAIGIDQLGASATEAEKAQFRLTAIISQSTFAQGAAADQAATTTGQVQQLANRVQDAATSFVEWTGPIGGAAAGLSSFGLEAGLAVGGLARLAQGIAQATSAAGGLGPTLKGLASSPAFGFTALAAGAGLAVIAVREVARSFDDNYYQTISEAVAQTTELDAAVLALIGSMNSASQALVFQGISEPINETVAALTDIQEKLWELENMRSDLNTSIGVVSDEDVAAFEALEAEIAALEAQYGDLLPAQQTAAAAQEDLTTILGLTGAGAAEAQQHALDLTTQYEAGTMSLQDYAFNLNWITENQAVYATGALEATAATEAQTAAVGALTNAKLANGNVVRDSVEDMHQWAEAVSYGNMAAEEQVVVVEASTDAMLANNNVVRDSVEAMHQWSEAVSMGGGTNTAAVNEYADSLLVLADNIITATGALEDQQAAAEATAEANALALSNNFLDQMAADAEAAEENLAALFNRLQNDIIPAMLEVELVTERVGRTIGIAAESVERGQDIWTAYNEALDDVADNMGAIADMDVLGDTAGTIIGQTQSWGQLSQSVADWAGSLAHGSLAMTDLDQAFLNGLISQRTYRAALEANHEIQVANAEIQEDLLRIQIKQMPVMAQVIQQQAEYIDGLADMDEGAQLAALGFLDQAQSAKALEVAQLAAASATEGQQAATTNMIQEMVNADPVLASMLEKMGLISITDGVVTVNFDEAVDADAAINNLTSSIDTLITLLGNIFNVETETDAPTTTAALNDLTAAALGIPKGPHHVATSTNAPDTTGKANALTEAALAVPSSRHINFTATDNASGTAYAVRDAINSIPLSRTISINTVQTVTGSTAVRLHGGPVDRFADGGVVASLSEAGPELLTFRDGGQALVPHPGIYMVEAGTSVLPAPATAARMSGAGSGRGGGGMAFYGPVSLYPAGADTYDAISQAAIRRGR